MKFIRFNFLDGRVFLFSLDELVSLDDDHDPAGLRVELGNGREDRIPYDIDEFCAKVFSDENGHDALIEIDEQDDPTEEPLIFGIPSVPPHPNG